jgi:hypothetical protein
LLAAACGDTDLGRSGTRTGAQLEPWFEERAADLGLNFVHFNGMTGEYHFSEMMGGGAALFDYDGDGDLDAYLVQGAMLDSSTDPMTASFPPQHPLPLTDRLYRNDLELGLNGASIARFVDVTSSVGDDGAAGSGYGMGVAVGDYDGDGDPDLYVTNLGPNHLLRNNGDGTFSDVTEESGSDDSRWSVAATFLDYDGDGALDLYVGNYVDYRLANDKLCRDTAGRRDYCGPDAYNGVGDRLFRSRGDGTFEDVSLASMVGRPRGKGLGVVAADLDRDGRQDLYVTNDGEPNFLWRNRGDGTFEETALGSGCAVSGAGLPQASMGVDAADYDGDGDLDLFVTHLTGEPNTLYRNDGDYGNDRDEGEKGALFVDISTASGLGSLSWPSTGFGTRWADLDGDGLLDLLVLNGAVKSIEESLLAGDPYPLAQRNLLFRGLADNRFEEVSASAGVPFELVEVSRGAAFGDVDNDGDVDVLFVNSNGPARLLINQTDGAAGWIGARLTETATTAGGAPRAPSTVGALAAVELPSGHRRLLRMEVGGGYASASDPRALLTHGTQGDSISVWIEIPGRAPMRLVEPPARRYLAIDPGR